jgi:hypothetical protein
VVGLFPFDHIEEGIHKSHDGRGVHPLRIYTGVFDQGIIGPEDQGIGIKEKKTFFVGHKRVISQVSNLLRF